MVQKAPKKLRRKLDQPISDKPKTKAAKTKGKQAPALTVRQFSLWLEWLRDHCGPRVYLAVLFTGAFGLRCSESLALKRADICLDAAIPKIRITGETPGARKSPGDVYVRKHHMKLTRSFLKDGIGTQRTVRHKHGQGAKGLIKKRSTSRFLLRALSSKAGRKLSSNTFITMPYMIMFAVKLHCSRNIWQPLESQCRPRSATCALIPAEPLS